MEKPRGVLGNRRGGIDEFEVFRKKTGRIIKLITAQEILDEQLAQKM